MYPLTITAVARKPGAVKHVLEKSTLTGGGKYKQTITRSSFFARIDLPFAFFGMISVPPSAAVEIPLAHIDGQAQAAGRVIAAAEFFRELDTAGLIVAADVVAGNHAHAHAAMHLRLPVSRVVACRLA